MEDTEAETEGLKPLDGKSLRKEASRWLERIKKSEKREEDWRKDAGAAEAAYACDNKSDEGQTAKQYDFNILHSNVETIVPAIYNSTPIPDIRRRRIEATGPEPTPPPQPQPGQPLDMGQDAQLQTAIQQYQAQAQEFASRKQRDTDAKTYGDLIERTIQVQIDDNRLDAEIEAEAQDSFVAGRGVVRLRFEADMASTAMTNERITFEAVSWRDFRMGPCTRWDRCPWVAFKVPMTHDEMEALADEGMLDAQHEALEERQDDDDDDCDDVIVWEVWDKNSKQVLFIEEQGRLLKRIEDPLGIPGFFPIPQPIQPIAKVGSTIPVCPFTIYHKLADELDYVTKRINKVMKGLKVRGIVAGDASKLIELATADDNEIKVETNLEALAQTGGLDKAIAWWPVEQGIKVLAQLYQQRESIKSSIYELTGISDIVRGASNAGETATAQQIKTQWGALRIQKMQRMIERQVRDIFTMMAQIISSKFSAETLTNMTGMEITEGVKALMAQPIDASYRVDVESDSTVRADLTRQKQDMTEFMSGTANFFASMAPVVQQAPEMAEPLSEIYAAAARFYKLGKGPEDALDHMTAIAKKAASQPRPNPEAEKAKAENEAKAKELELKTKEVDGKLDIERQKLALERTKAGDDHNFRVMEAGAKQNEDGTLEGKEDRTESAIMQALFGLAQGQQQQNEAMMAGLSQLAQGNQMIAAAVTAPKRTEFVIDQATGKPTGAVQTPMIQPGMVN